MSVVRTRLRSTFGKPWQISMALLFLYMFMLPNILGKGIGPYAFTVMGPLFLAMFLVFILLNPNFSLRIRGGRESVYFFGLPVLTAGWWIVLGTDDALFELVHIVLGAATILLMLWLLRTARDIHRLVNVVKIGGIILCVWAIGQYVLGTHEKPSAGWSNPNYLTTYLALIAPILWVEALGLVTKPKWTSTLLLGVFSATMILAGSRANLLALLVQGAVVIWQKFSIRSTIRSYVLRGSFILLLLIGGGAVTQAVISMQAEGGIQEQISKGYGSAFIRAIMIYDGVEAFWESRGLGLGAGNLTYEYSSQPEQFTGEKADNNIYPIHNFLLHLAAQYGIPGLLLFGTTYLSLLWRLSRQKILHGINQNKSINKVEIVRLSIWAFLISFVIISISVSYLFNRRPFYIAFGTYIVVNQYLLRKSYCLNEK